MIKLRIFTLIEWNRLWCPSILLLSPLRLRERLSVIFSFSFRAAITCLFIFSPLFGFVVLLLPFQARGGRWLMGTLGDEREFNWLLCLRWQAARLGRVVEDVVVWGAAAGVWGERLGANTAVVLHNGQQVKLRLWCLPPSYNNKLPELKWLIMKCISYI